MAVIDKLFMNLVAAATKANHNPANCTPAKTAYVLRKYEMATNAFPTRKGPHGLRGSTYTRARKGRAEAAAYDRRYALSDAYYQRDTSHWAGR